MLKRLLSLLLSCVLSAVATAAFLAAVGAVQDGLVVVLFGGFWIGIHSFVGFVRLSYRNNQIVGLKLLSRERYEELRHKKTPRV